jgi:hypothetical protein
LRVDYVVVALSSLSIVAACSSSEGSSYPYPPNETRVIGSTEDDDGKPSDGGPDLVGITPVRMTSTSRSAPAKDACGDGATADVIVSADGEVLSTICYPNADYDVVALGDQAEDPGLGNDVVAVVDDSDDGADIDGDLVIEGNNVIVYGRGPAVSVVGGDLDVHEDNAIVRGVRIAGDVLLEANDTALVYCVIEGDLHVVGNDNSIALCQVWGRITIEGNDTVLVSNLIAGDQAIAGMNLHCNDNHRFTDIDGDGAVQDDDVLAPVSCNASGP